MEKIFRTIKSCLHRHRTAGKLLSVLVVAASFVGTAVIAYADTTSTIRPGSNTIVTAKPSGNDCYVYPEGFYFYVQPYQSARTVGDIASGDSKKTNFDGRTLAELLNEEFYASYRFSYQFEAFSNLRQSPAAIKYVPKAVVDKFAIEENWMQKKTYFYETKGTSNQNDEMRFHAGSAVPNVKDKKFGMPVYGNNSMKKPDFEALAKTGVFYESLEKLVMDADKDGKLKGGTDLEAGDAQKAFGKTGLNDSRTKAHDAAISACSVLNRMARLLGAELFCVESDSRTEIAEFIGSFVAEMFLIPCIRAGCMVWMTLSESSGRTVGRFQNCIWRKVRQKSFYLVIDINLQLCYILEKGNPTSGLPD